MTRNELKSLKIGDVCVVNKGNDKGVKCKVVYMDGDQLVVKPLDNIYWGANSCKSNGQGSLRVTSWTCLDIYKEGV